MIVERIFYPGDLSSCIPCSRLIGSIELRCWKFPRRQTSTLELREVAGSIVYHCQLLPTHLRLPSLPYVEPFIPDIY